MGHQKEHCRRIKAGLETTHFRVPLNQTVFIEGLRAAEERKEHPSKILIFEHFDGENTGPHKYKKMPASPLASQR